MDCKLTPAEINHLRRLIGWVACEIGHNTEVSGAGTASAGLTGYAGDNNGERK